MTRPLTGPGQSLRDHDNLIRQGQPMPPQPRVILRSGKAVAVGSGTAASTSGSVGPVGAPTSTAVSGTSGASGFARVNAVDGAVVSVTGPSTTSVTADYSVVDGDDVVVVDASSGTVSVTLPLSSANSGRLLSIVKTDSSANGVSVAPTSPDTIDGATLFSLARQYDSAWFYSDGSNWLTLVKAPSSAIPFPGWNNPTSYSAGQIVSGSDGNLYRSLVASNLAHDPTTDDGTHWELWYLRASITLNCGDGQRFAGSTTDPAGIQQAVDFIANAVGAASPSTATVTIQIANNPTAAVSSGASPTSFSSATLFNVGTVFLFTSGTVSNIGKSCAVTAMSGSGPYTYTVSNTYDTTGLSSTPVAGDGFTATYGYGTHTLWVDLPNIGANVAVNGAASTVVTSTYPSLSTAISGGSIPNGTYYCAVTYTSTDSSGSTCETMSGAVSSQVVAGTNASTLTCAGFTLPPGAAGANLYVSDSAGGALHKQASFAITSGVAASLTITSYNAAGTNAPMANPPAACYPVAITGAWASSVNAVVVQNGRGISFDGLYLRGAGTGETNGTAFVAQGNAAVTLGPRLAVSNFNCGLRVLTGASMIANGIQIDACADGVMVDGSSAYCDASSSVVQHCSSRGLVGRGQSCILATNAYAGFCGTASAYASYGGYIRFDQSSTVQMSTYGSGAASSPTLNIAGNANAFVTDVSGL